MTVTFVTHTWYQTIIAAIFIRKQLYTVQGSKKVPSVRPGQVDFPACQVTFHPPLTTGKGPGKLSAN